MNKRYQRYTVSRTAAPRSERLKRLGSGSSMATSAATSRADQDSKMPDWLVPTSVNGVLGLKINTKYAGLFTEGYLTARSKNPDAQPASGSASWDGSTGYKQRLTVNGETKELILATILEDLAWARDITSLDARITDLENNPGGGTAVSWGTTDGYKQPLTVGNSSPKDLVLYSGYTALSNRISNLSSAMSDIAAMWDGTSGYVQGIAIGGVSKDLVLADVLEDIAWESDINSLDARITDLENNPGGSGTAVSWGTTDGYKQPLTVGNSSPKDLVLYSGYTALSNRISNLSSAMSDIAAMWDGTSGYVQGIAIGGVSKDLVLADVLEDIAWESDVDSLDARITDLEDAESSYVTLGGAQTIYGAKTFTADITAHGVIPQATNTYSLGGNSKFWNRLFVKRIYFYKHPSDATQDVYIEYNATNKGLYLYGGGLYTNSYLTAKKQSS